VSRENVEVVRKALAAVNGRDLDGYLSLSTPDWELVTPFADIEGSFKGEKGVREFFSWLAQGTREFRFEPERIEPAGGDRVVALLRLTVVSKGGIRFTESPANVYELAAGKIRRVRVYRDQADALEAVGLG
jgi:ketosteroid isomerase-like protein